MQTQSLYSDTYVGDTFTITVMRADKGPLRAFDGLTCKLIGFNKIVKSILSHEINANVPEPGFYETIGDPVVRVETGHIIEIPLMNLVPINYRFTDRLPKNHIYLQAKRKHRFVGNLPLIPYNIGDRVLVSHHGIHKEDFVTEILDVTIKGGFVFFIISPSDKVEEIRYDRVIDVIEHGELTELERLGKLHRCHESFSNRRVSRFRYTDDENTQLPED